MTALPNSPRSARFGPFRLDITTGELHRQERRVRLQHQPFQILVLLLERAGEMVTRDEIRTRLWGSDTIVEFERSVATAVKKLRQALGDNASRPRYIETLARRGYRWVAPVAWDQTAPAATSGTQTTASASAGVRLVGREGPLAALSASLQRAAAGERQIVLIAGEPGIGKTALIDEFERRALGALPGIRCGRGHCVGEYGSTEAYYPVLEAIGELCRGPDRAAAIAILAAQAPTWLVQFPTLVAAPQRDALRREILGATRKRMLREACNAFEAIASERPLILFFEDFHWADPSSIALVSTIARRRARTRLMIVATYQTVDPKAALCVVRNDLVVHGLAQDISLEPLTESDVRDYLSGDEPGTPPSAELAHLVHGHSDGNPLFIVAALDHLTRGGLISRENGAFQLRVPPAQIDIGVPESLRRMIEIQIERLTKEEREALEAASVMGVSFLVYACAGAMDADCESYEQLYETLSRRHHVVRRAGRPRMANGTSLSRYEFVHAMYREVLYGRQAGARRARLHRRMGEQLERLFSHDRSGSPDLAPELAHHFEAGGEWRRAATYLAIMAETAGRRSVPRDATALLQRAIDLAARLPDAERATIELDLLQKLAAAYLVSFDSRVVHAYETLIARAAHYGSVRAEIRGLIGLAYPSSWVSTKRCLDAVERALMLGETQTDHVLRARVRASCLVRRIWAGGWNEADAADCRSALAVIRAAGNRRVLAEHVADCTFVDWASSQYRVARRDSVESRAILLEGSDNPYLSFTYWLTEFILPWSLLFLGEWGEMLREGETGIAIATKNADDYRAQTVRVYQAWLHLNAMDFAEVITICESILRVVGQPDRSPWRRFCLVLAGSAESALGNEQRALDHLMSASTEMQRHPVIHDWYTRMLLESALTDLWLGKGDVAQAQLHADRFLEAALSTAEHTWQALAWEASARVAIVTSDFHRARESVVHALESMEGFETPLAAWRVHATAADLAERTGSADQATRHRELSQATILILANSLPPEHRLRATFLSSALVTRVRSY